MLVFCPVSPLHSKQYRCWSFATTEGGTPAASFLLSSFLQTISDVMLCLILFRKILRPFNTSAMLVWTYSESFPGLSTPLPCWPDLVQKVPQAYQLVCILAWPCLDSSPGLSTLLTCWSDPVQKAPQASQLVCYVGPTLFRILLSWQYDLVQKVLPAFQHSCHDSLTLFRKILGPLNSSAMLVWPCSKSSPGL